MTRERKIFLGILGLAAAAVVLDQGFLQPQSASADEVVRSESAPSGFSGLISGGGEGAEEPAGKAVPAVSDSGLAARLDHVKARFGDADLVGNAFSAKANPDAVDSAAGLDDPLQVSASGGADGPTLSGLMPSRRGRGVAIVDGQAIRVGQQVGTSGWVLTAVTKTGAVIERGNEKRSLSMRD